MRLFTTSPSPFQITLFLSTLFQLLQNTAKFREPLYRRAQWLRLWHMSVISRHRWSWLWRDKGALGAGTELEYIHTRNSKTAICKESIHSRTFLYSNLWPLLSCILTLFVLIFFSYHAELVMQEKLHWGDRQTSDIRRTLRLVDWISLGANSIKSSNRIFLDIITFQTKFS